MTWEHYKKEISDKQTLPPDWYIIGIDLGTTNSVISYYNINTEEPEPIDVSMGFGKIPLPSVVQYRPETDEWLIGEEAFRTMKLYPNSTIRSVKSHMGTTDTIKVAGDSYIPEEISAKILTELISQLYNLNPNAEVAGLVVSVPYDFDNAAKKATIKAIELAGLKDKLICLIEEPKAAVLSYSFTSDIDLNQKIMVFDFGGGTLDITIFNVDEKTNDSIFLKVISEGGSLNHGGDVVDQTLVNHLYKQWENKTGQPVDNIEIENLLEIFQRAREAKERLSGVKSHRIPFTFAIPPFMEEIKRDGLEEMLEPFIEKTKKLVTKALAQSHIGPLNLEDIDMILLEGGSCGMPWVKTMLKSIFNENIIYSSKTPALDISIGATYYAAIKMGLLNRPGMEIPIEIDVTLPHDIGLEIEGRTGKTFFPIISRGTSYALSKKSHTFTLSGETEEDMTTLSLKVVERMSKEDTIEQCKTIGQIEVAGLPKRPSGKTRLRLSLVANEENMTIKGIVEDLGFGKDYDASGFIEEFEF